MSTATVPGSAVEERTDPVEAHGLVKRYGTTVACDHVDLTVRRGELVALVGRSGSGKSTLLRLLNGLVTPDSGEVRVLGTDVGSLRGSSMRALRRQVGMVFQQFQLLGRLSVLENVLTGALGHVRGPRYGVLTWSKRHRADALEQLDRVGLGDRAFQRTDTLSGGQQQRVGIARALMQRPRLVLADEPVASLDPDTAAQVLEILFRICAEDELTVVCSLHQVDLVLRWAHRVVGMRDGAVVLDAAADSLDGDRLATVYKGAA